MRFLIEGFLHAFRKVTSIDEGLIGIDKVVAPKYACPVFASGDPDDIFELFYRFVR